MKEVIRIEDIKVPDFTFEVVRLVNAIKTMNANDAKNELLGILESVHIKAVVETKKGAA